MMIRAHTMRGPRPVSLAMAMAVATLFGAGCPSRVNRVRLNAEDRGRTVSLAAGDRIELTLQTIGPGPYTTPQLSSGAVRFLSESTPGPPNPGGVSQLFRFEAAASGRAELTIPHSGESPQRPQTPAFALTFDVR
jgi:hypothetical protein